jgi:hypothetical protein
MTAISERARRYEAEGYWAVQVRWSESAGEGPSYLCHAQNDRDAARMAGLLMGSAARVRGFAYYRIEPPFAAGLVDRLPSMNAYEQVASPAQWERLMAAHAASELAFEERVSGLTAKPAERDHA